MLKRILQHIYFAINPFYKPGYEVSVATAEADISAYDRIKEIIAEKGFIFIVDRDNISRENIISEYTRKNKYLIAISVTHSKITYPQRRSGFVITIANYWDGSDPELKTDMDNIGASLYEALSHFTNKERVFMRSKKTAMPEYG